MVATTAGNADLRCSLTPGTTGTPSGISQSSGEAHAIASWKESTFGEDAGETDEIQEVPSFSPRNFGSSAIATRTWPIVSRSRTVTVLSSRVWKSTVMQNGVPTSS